MKYHLIAIGGSAMHSLAISLKNQGHEISGSDDEIFEPAKSRLLALELLPIQEGWYEEKITQDIDAVILGMHAKENNPELKKALDLGIKVYSYPEFLYEIWKDKVRIVIAGSHGKTTITSTLMHLFLKSELDFDFMVGAQLKGFNNPVKITNSSTVAIIEGDEYLSSALDKNPKFLHYKPHIAIISGIAWDHINVFKTFDDYIFQFERFINSLEPNATLIYYENDSVLKEIVERNKRTDLKKIPYRIPSFERQLKTTSFIFDKSKFKTTLQGEHNLSNLVGALQLLKAYRPELLINENIFDDFEGPSKRLETIYKDDNIQIIKDFAHAPSKVKASLEGIKNFNPTKKVFAFLELHTYSSLNPEFIKQYSGTLDNADFACVFYSKKALQIKGLPDLNPSDIQRSFKNNNIVALNNKLDLIDLWKKVAQTENAIYLMMSSGNWEGADLLTLSEVSKY